MARLDHILKSWLDAGIHDVMAWFFDAEVESVTSENVELQATLESGGHR
ncbi:MAG: hypothetical protein HC837_16410 [Chloroflexaceae bacterium]|nr:hypothetical protein [Chloroflexaceae bacterium]